MLGLGTANIAPPDLVKVSACLETGSNHLELVIPHSRREKYLITHRPLLFGEGCRQQGSGASLRDAAIGSSGKVCMNCGSVTRLDGMSKI